MEGDIGSVQQETDFSIVDQPTVDKLTGHGVVLIFVELAPQFVHGGKHTRSRRRGWRVSGGHIRGELYRLLSWLTSYEEDTHSPDNAQSSKKIHFILQMVFR
ncbi:hypothetical protein N799_04115 [Lysobacter arseniciresistens ZS79]|uniref:Uncharacterized protein n=1 Tax=Lysobacter arseniciresistens ZS79 TaxID=913325 RepID=A0A0A0ETH1_9GAMM|nr:hypothetical protein N799_04115 [Lysobacter arseniciresistens ZS79]